ncbi:MAG: hypothetical protein WC006_03120 [Bacilli bacterium]|nr:hypothetical protein [Bacilli bacterium]
MRKKILLIISSVMLIVTIITTVLVAFLLNEIIIDYNSTIGEVEVEYDIYFTKDGEDELKASEVEISPGITKSGVYFVNLDNINSNRYISYLNIDILVKSNVNTYVRVKIIEQLTLTITDHYGHKTEISILSPRTEFDLAENWFYHEETEYYYYKTPVKGIEDGTEIIENRIKFVIPFEDTYNPSPMNYSLQLGLQVSGVQTKGGAKYNWKLDNPPWGGNWQ